MKIRKLTKSDMEKSLNLSQFAFQYKLTEDERTHRLKISRPEETIGHFLDGELVAKMTILPLQVQIDGVEFNMGGVSGVATYPEHRRTGLVKELLQLGLKEMKEKGQLVSYLFPFSIPFYRKYGWELIVDYQKLRILKEQLPRFAKTRGTMKQVDEKSVGIIKEVYEKYARNYSGMLIRHDSWWENSVLYRKKGRIAAYSNAEGTPKGYLIYEVNERIMTIKELVALDEESRKGIWNFISNHDSMAEEYIIQQLPLYEPYPYWLGDPKIKKEVTAYFMARIVDVEQFLKSYPFQNRMKTTLFFHVSDEFASWNAATFQINILDSGEIQVKKHIPKTSGVCQQEPKRGIQCDIKDLTAMFFNYQNPTSLYDMDRIKGPKGEIEVLEQLLVKKPTGFIDFF